MRIALAGAGDVGQSIARDLTAAGHLVLLIERYRANFDPGLVPAAHWLLADACELDQLQRAEIGRCDAVIACSGDDKVNLVFSLLCKIEFAVPRVVARVNNPANQWLFNDSWGVDVAVSTPEALVTSVNEALSPDRPVRLMSLPRGRDDIVEIRLTSGSDLVGSRVTDLDLPDGAALLAVRRANELFAPHPAITLSVGDEILLLASADVRFRFPSTH